MTKVTKEGVVISDSMDKTVVVKHTFKQRHPRYKKVILHESKFVAHDPKNEYKTGDWVKIEECRPLSKTKRWRVIEGKEIEK